MTMRTATKTAIRYSTEQAYRNRFRRLYTKKHHYGFFSRFVSLCFSLFRFPCFRRFWNNLRSTVRRATLSAYEYGFGTALSL